MDATWAVVGLDPLRDVLDYLGPRLDAALAEKNPPTPRQCGKSEGHPLDYLISEKAIEPADALTIGLTVLATLADLCRTAEASGQAGLERAVWRRAAVPARLHRAAEERRLHRAD